MQVKNSHTITTRVAEDIYAIMQQILRREHTIDRAKDLFWVVSLNEVQNILAIDLINMGRNVITSTKPTDVFSIPLQKKASSIIRLLA